MSVDFIEYNEVPLISMTKVLTSRSINTIYKFNSNLFINYIYTYAYICIIIIIVVVIIFLVNSFNCSI